MRRGNWHVSMLTSHPIDVLAERAARSLTWSSLAKWARCASICASISGVKTTPKSITPDRRP
jgi:hypothetical protein